MGLISRVSSRTYRMTRHGLLGDQPIYPAPSWQSQSQPIYNSGLLGDSPEFSHPAKQPKLDGLLGQSPYLPPPNMPAPRDPGSKNIKANIEKTALLVDAPISTGYSNSTPPSQKPAGLRIDPSSEHSTVTASIFKKAFEKQEDPSKTLHPLLTGTLIYRSDSNMVTTLFTNIQLLTEYSWSCRKVIETYDKMGQVVSTGNLMLAAPVELSPQMIYKVFGFMHGIPITLPSPSDTEAISKLYITAKYFQVTTLVERISQNCTCIPTAEFTKMSTFVRKLPRLKLSTVIPTTIDDLPQIATLR